MVVSDASVAKVQLAVESYAKHSKSAVGGFRDPRNLFQGVGEQHTIIRSTDVSLPEVRMGQVRHFADVWQISAMEPVIHCKRHLQLAKRPAIGYLRLRTGASSAHSALVATD
eukprot:TRINITY_DN15292_c0_g1_i1.p1 TRINITY_DN15292_c0_g1~~TRINITY_DN15292_c0_g1_i1.p1  ORF type:complete len:112 (+),score=13.37 TRINITY_DN15292_c0_g1_i1:333-668(+)